MAEGDQSTNPEARADQPTWKDLADFTRIQAENDRRVIDFWFKLAASLLGFILFIASVAVGVVGWRTIADARATAQTTARDAAKAKVEEVLKQPELQNLVRETASDPVRKRGVQERN